VKRSILWKQDERRIVMSEIAIVRVRWIGVLTSPDSLENGEIGDAIDCFAEEFRFKDHGIDLSLAKKALG